MAEDLQLYKTLENHGVNPKHLGTSTTLRVASDIGKGLLTASTDAGAKAMNTVLDVTNAFGIEDAIYSAVSGTKDEYEPFRFDTMTDVLKDFGEVSALQEGTSDFAGIVGGVILSGGTKGGVHILNWGSKGGIGRRVFAEAVTALPADVLLSDTSGEHMFFDDNTKEDIISRRAKNIVENVGMGAMGDLALSGMSRAYKAWRGKGKTPDDATQKAFNQEVPAGQADEINKVRPTAELNGTPQLAKVYEENPMAKIDNREVLEEITPTEIKQMDNVANAELDHRHGVNERMHETMDEPQIANDRSPVEETTANTRFQEADDVDGIQMRESYLNLFDAVASGKINDEVTSKYTWQFLRAFSEEADADLAKVMDGSVAGKDREALVRKLRTKFKNNPTLLDPKNWQDTSKVSRILSDKLGVGVKKKPRTLFEIHDNYVKLATQRDTNKKFAKALRKLAADQGMDSDALMRNMSELGVMTDRLPEYIRGLSDLTESTLGAMVKASKALKAMIKKDGKLDMSSKAFREWMTAFGASNEVYAGVARIRGNIGTSMRVMREHGNGTESFLQKFDFYKSKGTTQAQEDASSEYMRATQMTNQYNESIAKGSKQPRPDGSVKSMVALAQDPEALTNELIKMIKNSSDIGRAKRLVSGSYKRDKQGLADMFISMGISNMLASFQTIGKIASSTANFILYKNTLIPAYAGIINKITAGDTGQRPIADVIQRWIGMADVAKKYMRTTPKQMREALMEGKTPEQIAEMSRGFRGMQIEGQGFSDMKFGKLLKFVDEHANNPITKFGGRLMTAPLWFGNQVMTKGIIPVDDFFRRVMLEAESSGAIHELWIKGINAPTSKVKEMSSAFDNFEDYRKTMAPLFSDVKKVLYDTREATEDEVRDAMNKVFNKYEVTRLDDDAQNVIMAEVLTAERKAAEAVSQETTDDLILGRYIKQSLNALESAGPIGRITASTLVPFQTAPINIMRSAMEETPGLNLLSKRWRDKYKGGGKDKNEAIAQVLSGLTVGAGAWTLVNSLPVYGHIPIEEMKGAQEMGIQPYSVVIGGRAYSFDFLGTFKAPLAMLADYKRYGMEGNNVEAFKQSLKTFALAAGNNPYFDSMQELTNLFSSGATEKDLVRFLTSKSTQFLQIGSGINRSIKTAMGGEIETSAMSEYYDGVWLRELDMRNKDNPAYRFFRDMTNPKAYIKKTNIFGETMTRSEGVAGFLPYITMGISSTPAPTSPGMVMLQELDLLNQDFTKIGDVELDSARAEEVKQRTFSDSGLGLGRVLNAYATDEVFMSSSDENRNKVISKLLQDHLSQVQSTMGLDVLMKQYDIDNLKTRLDYDSSGALLDMKSSARSTSEIIYNMGIDKYRKSTLDSQGIRKILE